MESRKLGLCLIAVVLGVTSAYAQPAKAQQFGKFEGNVVTEWLDPEGDNRRMRLLSDFAYLAPDGERWSAPSGWVVDGASIPRVLWSTVGSPYEGGYRRASVIHDVACDLKARPWRAVHRAFYNAMRADGVGLFQAKLMYAAVFAGGPRWELQTSPLVSAAQAPQVTEDMLRAANSSGARGTAVFIRTVAMPVSTAMPMPPPAAATSVTVVVEPPRRLLTEADLTTVRERLVADPSVSLEELEQLVEN